MKSLRYLFVPVLAVCSTLGVMAQTAADSVYVFRDDQADAGYFLPAPPEVGSMEYVDDLLQWQWGKTQRPTPRGTQASIESMWKPEAMRIVMAQALGLDTISDELTPALSRLLVKSYNTGNLSTWAAKRKYMRIRPFMQMGEDTWALFDDDFLRTNGSYPSGHTSFGWATALAFAEMWPELQDTILRRGFEFGENRIITGAHYQSDVNAGYLCAAASIAHAHALPYLAADIVAARAEYAAIKGLPVDYNPAAAATFPRGERILNQPVDTASYRYLGDLMRYWKAKTLRDTPRGEQAVSDVDKTLPYLSRIFGEALGVPLSAETTPAVCQLLALVKQHSAEAVVALKLTNFRKRPFVQLGEPTSVPSQETGARGTSSFASGHACLGWSIALVLTEMAPDRQNEVLRCGFDYGESRLITGYHWATDIEAARLLACAVVARLHSDPAFLTLMQQARTEYRNAALHFAR